jgi:hypothetical protein
MKVHELIEELEKYSGDLDVVITLGEDISYDESINLVCNRPVVRRGRKSTNTLIITDDS